MCGQWGKEGWEIKSGRQAGARSCKTHVSSQASYPPFRRVCQWKLVEANSTKGKYAAGSWNYCLHSSPLCVPHPYPCHGLLILGVTLGLALDNGARRRHRLEMCFCNGVHPLTLLPFVIERTRLGESKEDERQTPGADVKHGAKPHWAQLKALCHWAFVWNFPLSFWSDLLRGIIWAVADQYMQDGEDFSEERLAEREYLV